MRAVVLGYHEVGCAGLEALLEAGVDVAAVFTHPDDPDENCWFRSLETVARAAGVPVYAPQRIDAPESVARIRAARPDVLFSFYYRRIVSPEILAIAPRGGFNLHGSLLPRFRGRSPTNWAIALGETSTGVTLHEMEPTPDTGPIVAAREVPIGPDDAARVVLARQVEAARVLLAEAVPRLMDGTAPRVPQDESLATLYPGRSPEDGRIDWSQSAGAIHDLVRAVTDPWPGAFSTVGGRRCLVWRTRPRAARRGGASCSAASGALLGRTADGVLVRCGAGQLEILRAQIPPGPAVEGPALARLLGPVPGPGFAGA